MRNNVTDESELGDYKQISTFVYTSDKLPFHWQWVTDMEYFENIVSLIGDLGLGAQIPSDKCPTQGYEK